MAAYNGHSSYNAWNVNLWLMNDEPTYRLMMACLRSAPNRATAVARLLSMLPERTPDGVRYTATNVRRAMAGL